MAKNPEEANIVPLPIPAPVPTARTIEAMVRKLAEKTDNIAWSDHALKRMYERDIPDVVAVEVLRSGIAKGEIESGKNAGEWKVKMTKPVKGRREVGVVVLTVRSARLFVKTVEWEDLT
jgi:hypothetical protein